MGMSSTETRQRFPFSYDAVFDGLLAVVPRAGFTLKSHDKVIGRITASGGASWTSWGENITIVVEKTDDNTSVVAIDSRLKVAINVGGSHRNSQNADKLIAELSAYLQRPDALPQ